MMHFPNIFENNDVVIENPNGIHGYKAFNPDWTCTPGGFFRKNKKQYTCPGMFETDSNPSVCHHGMHFCVRLEDIFNYYNTQPEKPKVAEVIAWGKVVKNGDKCSTNKLEIVREIPWEEVIQRTNTGADCTGIINSGDFNSGDRNSGDFNSGDRNSGNFNSGDRNSGNFNSGDFNSGDFNSGDFNSGDRNSGNRNSGDFNSGDFNSGDFNSGDFNSGDFNSGDFNSGDFNVTDFSSGCFNTEEADILMFNKPSGMTMRDWWHHRANALLRDIPKNIIEWIPEYMMNDKEKAENPSYETTGGYLKVLDKRDTAQRWWDGLSQYDQAVVMSLPNFDADVFYKCTGINVETEDTECI